MDIENLKRAGEIEKKLASYNTALHLLRRKDVAVSLYSRHRYHGSILCDAGLMKDLRRLLQEHIDVLMEEAKTL